MVAFSPGSELVLDRDTAPNTFPRGSRVSIQYVGGHAAEWELAEWHPSGIVIKTDRYFTFLPWHRIQSIAIAHAQEE